MEFVFEDRPSESPLIEAIWRTESPQEGTFMSQATSRWEIVVWRYEGETHITVRGPETKAVLSDSPADAEFFGMRFKMGTFMPHLPISKLIGLGITLPEASSKSFWLQGEAWELPTFENADTFISRLVRDGLLVHDPVIEAVLEGQEAYLSPRSLQYRFLRATGLTQSTVRQIERARLATALLIQGVPILDAAHETGYFDQAHLTRSLRRFMGQTPTQIATSSHPE